MSRRIKDLRRKNKSLVFHNKRKKEIIALHEKVNEELVIEENEKSEQVKELLKYKDKYYAMEKTAERLRSLGFSYYTLIMELTHEVVMRGGKSGPFLEKLTKISSVKDTIEK